MTNESGLTYAVAQSLEKKALKALGDPDEVPTPFWVPLLNEIAFNMETIDELVERLYTEYKTTYMEYERVSYWHVDHWVQSTVMRVLENTKRKEEEEKEKQRKAKEEQEQAALNRNNNIDSAPPPAGNAASSAPASTAAAPDMTAPVPEPKLVETADGTAGDCAPAAVTPVPMNTEGAATEPTGTAHAVEAGKETAAADIPTDLNPVAASPTPAPDAATQPATPAVAEPATTSQIFIPADVAAGPIPGSKWMYELVDVNGATHIAEAHELRRKRSPMPRNLIRFTIERVALLDTTNQRIPPFWRLRKSFAVESGISTELPQRIIDMIEKEKRDAEEKIRVREEKKKRAEEKARLAEEKKAALLEKAAIEAAAAQRRLQEEAERRAAGLDMPGEINTNGNGMMMMGAPALGGEGGAAAAAAAPNEPDESEATIDDNPLMPSPAGGACAGADAGGAEVKSKPPEPEYIPLPFEQAIRKFKPNGVKETCLKVLLECGAQGADLPRIMELATQLHGKTWENPVAGKTTLITAMTADDKDKVFCRVGPGIYALRHLVPPEVLAANKNFEYVKGRLPKGGNSRSGGGSRSKKRKSEGNGEGGGNGGEAGTSTPRKKKSSAEAKKENEEGGTKDDAKENKSENNEGGGANGEAHAPKSEAAANGNHDIRKYIKVESSEAQRARISKMIDQQELEIQLSMQRISLNYQFAVDKIQQFDTVVVDESTFVIPVEEYDYRGDPTDRKALLAHKKDLRDREEKMKKDLQAAKMKNTQMKRTLRKNAQNIFLLLQQTQHELEVLRRDREARIEKEIATERAKQEALERKKRQREEQERKQNQVKVVKIRKRDIERAQRREEREREKAAKLARQKAEREYKELLSNPVEDLLLDDPEAKLPGSRPNTNLPRPHEDLMERIDRSLHGALIMTWDFCLSFGPLLNISHFTMEQLELSVLKGDIASGLTLELHFALLHAALRGVIVELDEVILKDEAAAADKHVMQFWLDSMDAHSWPEIARRFITCWRTSTVSRTCQSTGDAVACVLALCSGTSYADVPVTEKVALIDILVENCLATGTIHAAMKTNMERHHELLADMRAVEEEKRAEMRAERDAAKKAAREEKEKRLAKKKAEEAAAAAAAAAEEAAQRLQNGTAAEKEDGADGGGTDGKSADDATANEDGSGGGGNDDANKGGAKDANDDNRDEDDENDDEDDEDEDDDEDDDENIDESMYILPASVKEYKGHPDDRRALLAHRAWVAKEEEQLAARLAVRRRQVEKIKREKAAAAKRASEEERREKAAREEARNEKMSVLKQELLTVPVRTAPLGSDRFHNRYWWFAGERDILYVQRSAQPLADAEFEAWGYYAFKDELSQLFHSLDPRGIRESRLRFELRRIYNELMDILHTRPESAIPDTPMKSQGRADDDDVDADTLVEAYVNSSRRGKSALVSLSAGAHLKTLFLRLVDVWMSLPGRKNPSDSSQWKAMQVRLTRMRSVDVNEAKKLAVDAESFISRYTKEDVKWAAAREREVLREAAKAQQQQMRQQQAEEDDDDDDASGSDGGGGTNGVGGSIDGDRDDEHTRTAAQLDVAALMKNAAFEPGLSASTTLWMSAREQESWLAQMTEASSSTQIAYLVSALIGRAQNIQVMPR